MTLPRWDSVAALYALQNSMMLTPCWPSAGPTGGAGVAAPALIWSLTIAESFRFLGGISDFLVGVPCAADLPAAGGGQILETWEKASSTGVSRPKMETRTLPFCASTLPSLIVAGSVAKGPSMTVTDSPTVKSPSTVALPPAAAAPAAAPPRPAA